MNKRLHILHLEDEPDFAELVRTLLEQDQLDAEVKCVGDRASFKKQLEAETFDVIISDYHLPSFTGLEAMAMAGKLCPQTPFILVSGTIGEHAAIESLKAGAADYVLKQHPERLPSAVRRAVKEARERAKLREAEMELARREKYFRALTENSLDVLCVMDRDGNFLYNSASIKNVLGYTPEDMFGENVFTRVHAEDLTRAQEALQLALDQPDRTVTLQVRYKNQAGEWRWLELVGKNRLADPEIKGIVATCRDVTDRRRVEEELRESEQQYRLLFQSNPNPVWVFDMETQKFLEVNEAAIQHYGHSREEFLVITMQDICAPGEKHPRDAGIPGAASQGRIWRHRRKDGSLMDAEIVWTPMVFHGRFAALAMAVDVTERLRVENRNAVFSKLSHELSSATTAAEAARIICKASDELFRWTDFALDLYDAGRDEVNSLLNITTVENQRAEIPPSQQPKTANALMRRVIKKGAELLSVSEAGEYAISTMLAPIRKDDRVIGLMLIQNNQPGSYSHGDLIMLQTLAEQCGGALERLQSREQLRESEERFRDLFENSPDAIFVDDLNGSVLDVNFAACVLHGMTRDQLIGRNAMVDLVSPSRREATRSLFQKLAAGKLSWAEGESLTADGRSTPIEVRAVRIEYRGKPALLLHVRDISERRAASAALQNSEALFRSVWESSVDGMRLADEHGVVVAANNAYCKLVGMEAQSLVGKPFTAVYAATEDHQAILNRLLERFEERAIQQEREEQHTFHDGRAVVLEISDSFIEIKDRPAMMLSLFRDITVQKRLEEQLRQSQKMEAIGQLAGGVAHDFNNILTIIHGHASLLTMSKIDASAAHSAQQITKAAERAAGLTRQLLTFSRRQLIQPKRLDLNIIVGNMTDMLGRIMGEDVKLELKYSDLPAIVEADAGMMEQVLLNLAVNARDAMPRGGQLMVRVSIEDVKEDYVRQHPAAHAGIFVSIENTDTGTGIPPENLPRIFEPFFTTKGIGKGTGLGLATVYGIVKQHQGWVEVESTVGKGTTFRIYIPHVGERVEPEKPASQVQIRGGTETILLVEDEKPVIELVASVLEKYGYKVLQAGTGAEAVEIWRSGKQEIHLLLTDLIMPGNMNGRELAETLWVERPDLKVIFTSGYTADIVGKDFKIESGLNFLQKPYHPQTLALAVRRCLDGTKT